MRRNLAWLWLVACGDAQAPTAVSAPDPTACEVADYSLCGSPLREAQDDGQPWPTFSAALAQEVECFDGRGAASPWRH
jgi:hypothetical protein